MRLLASYAAVLLSVAIAACGESSISQTRAESVRLVDGGAKAFDQRVASLAGTPIVVNQWASWCGPCRAEFGLFAEAAERYRGRVAFLGVDAKDSRSDAAAFLEDNPVPYDNFYDPDLKISRSFDGGRAWPTTAFYGPDGKVVFTHFGAYKDRAQLDADVKEHALDG